MQLLNIAIISIASIVVLFILTKIIGNRQISQMTMFDYIIGISIGSIAAEMATELENPTQPLVAMIVYAGAATIISLATYKSIGLRKFFTGVPIVIYSDEKIYKTNLKTVKMDINDFLMQCRNAGHFDLGQVETIILEPNGRLSILPKADYRPASPRDMDLLVQKEQVFYNVVIDGKFIKENIKVLGIDEGWLSKEFAKKNTSSHDVLLCVCDEKLNITVYKKESIPSQNSMYI